MKLTVNGVGREVESALLTPLLFVLREELEITGPKAGCQQGGCGACTVLVDGRALRSCLLPVVAVEGAEILTVEGLGTPEHLAPVQQAFVHHYGMQCGFCTPGFLMASHAYIAGGGTDDRKAIQHALAGHSCRCTGYQKIIEAVAAAARGASFDLTQTAPGEHTILRTAGGAA